jgi:hypothetical protein
MNPPVPYTWKIGVDRAFGYLARSDGTRLAESRRFLSEVGLAIDLADGSAVLTAADGSSTWQPLEPARACELAQIPPPEVDGAAETDRRLDPFHVERHTSPLFLTLVTLANEQTLPCGHALRAWLAGVWDRTFNGPYLEAPETFAASVIERTAASGLCPRDAVLAQIAAETMLPADAPDLQRVAAETGWQTAADEIDVRAREFARRLDIDRGAQQDADRAHSDQLSLI